MTWLWILIALVVLVGVAVWAIPRARGARVGTDRVDSEPVPPTPAAAPGTGVPLAPGVDPPVDEAK